MSEKDQVIEILKKAISPPFKATMGDGAGTVVVDGRPGYVWCRKVGRSEMLMQAFNRGAPTIEGIIVYVQESRIDRLGYEVIGVTSGGSPDNIYPPLAPHAWTHEWRPGIGRDRVSVYPRSWGYLRAEPIETGSMNVWVTPGWLYYGGEYIWYPGGYSPAFGPPAGSTWYQTLYMDPSDQSLHIVDGITGGYGYAGIPVPPDCMLPIAAVESTGTFGSVTENMIEDIRLFMDPIEDCGTGTALGAIEIEEDDVWILDATILNFEGGGGKVTDEGGGKATIDITGEAEGVSYCNIQWHVDGPLQTGTEVGEARLAPPGFDMLGAWMYCKNPGSAGNTIVDINKNDVTIFTVQANRPTLPWNDPDNKIKGGALGVTTLVEGDKLSMDIDGVATGAEDLDVLLILGATGTGPAGLGLIEIQEDDAKVTDASVVNFEGGGGKVTDEGGGKVTIDITPGAGGNGKGTIWVYPGGKATALTAPFGEVIGDFIARGAAQDELVYFNFGIPSDFSSLDKAVAIFIAKNADGSTFDLNTDYGADGEAYNANSESQTTANYNFVLNEIVEVDVSGVLTGIAAGDYIGLTIDKNSATGLLQWIGALIEFTRT